MPIETYEFESGTRYFWVCPVCSEVSLPFKEPDAAAAERAKHLGCLSGRRGGIMSRSS